nr:PHB depolymerase family esterase [Streptomonospora litoralis]
MLAVLAAAVGLVTLDTARAEAATLQRVSSFGANPGALDMYAYVPDSAGSGAPLVVLLHGCTQNATGYHGNSGWDGVADERGAVLVYAQQRSGNNMNSCFNWFQPGDTARGSGEAASIRQMIDYAAAQYGATGGVYVSGLSAGGAMASEMLSAYPEVFAGGSIVGGLPTGCAGSLLEATTCMNSGKQQSAEQWGDEVRAKNPGYSGPWPRVEIWHGSADYTVRPVNAEASRDQWVNVHGASTGPNRTEQRPSGTTTEFHDAGGEPVVALNTVSGMGHGTPVDPSAGCGSAGAYFLDTLCSAQYTADFLGVGSDTGPDPDPTPDPTPTPEPTPSPDPTPEPGECVTASNYAHVAAGRAEHRMGRAYTVGGGDDLGLWSLGVTSSVRETEPGHWEEVSGC